MNRRIANEIEALPFCRKVCPFGSRVYVELLFDRAGNASEQVNEQFGALVYDIVADNGGLFKNVFDHDDYMNRFEFEIEIDEETFDKKGPSIVSRLNAIADAVAFILSGGDYINKGTAKAESEDGKTYEFGPADYSAVYSPKADITFVMKYEITEGGTSEQVIGFYYGLPEKGTTVYYIAKHLSGEDCTKAVFDIPTDED